MKGTTKKALLTASVLASMSLISTAPAFATSLTRPSNIQFHTYTNGVLNTSGNPQNIQTWTYSNGAAVYDSTGIGGVNRRVLNDFNNFGNTQKAAAALMDSDSATNVELFVNGERVSDNVGFTAQLGKNTIKVESVTQADWADGKLARAWLTGFGNTYGSLMQSISTTPSSNMFTDFQTNFNTFVSYLSTNGFNSAGDANIGDIAYNEKTGQLKVDLVGHLDAANRYVDTREKVTQGGRLVNNSNYKKRSPNFARNSTGNQILDSMLFNLSLRAFDSKTPFQVSEIAKVTFNGDVDYAFSFTAIDSGAIAGDRNTSTDNTSHTGIYSWNKTFAKPTSVPEPSIILALMAISGVTLLKQSSLKKTQSN